MITDADRQAARNVSEVRDGDKFGETLKIDGWAMWLIIVDEPPFITVYGCASALPGTTAHMRAYIQDHAVTKDIAGLRELADEVCRHMGLRPPDWAAITQASVQPPSRECPCGIVRADCDYHRAP